jgi:hypothetical protein
MAHGAKECVSSMRIPINPSELWLGFIIGSEPDNAIEMMTHTAVTQLSDNCLTATAALLSHFSLFGVKRTPCGRSTLCPCLTIRTLTSVL